MSKVFFEGTIHCSTSILGEIGAFVLMYDSKVHNTNIIIPPTEPDHYFTSDHQDLRTGPDVLCRPVAFRSICRI